MGDTVPVGSMRLYDSAVPDVPAGSYRLRSSLDISAGSALAAPVAHDAFVEVDGPRFALSPTDVATVHPPPGSVGVFGERLPQLVLTRRTLPWERRFSDGTPWLVLLVVREDEATLLPPTPLREAVGDDHFAVLDAAAPIDGDGPPVSVLLAADPIIQAGLLPAGRDVPLLTHVRQVNLADTELAMADDDGWFAVVVANRLPLNTGSYRACLVSLEGREVLLRASAAQPTPLVVLYQWEFEVGPGGLFEVLARQLDVDALQLPGDAAPVLDRVDHDGRRTTVRYRGPLRARPPDPARAPADASGEAAAELGRLLGQADGRFLQDLHDWHRGIDLAELGAITAAARTAPGPAAVAGLHRAVADPWQVPPAAADLVGLVGLAGSPETPEGTP
jgi:hypothetical protein